MVLRKADRLMIKPNRRTSLEILLCPVKNRKLGAYIIKKNEFSQRKETPVNDDGQRANTMHCGTTASKRVAAFLSYYVRSPELAAIISAV